MRPDRWPPMSWAERPSAYRSSTDECAASEPIAGTRSVCGLGRLWLWLSSTEALLAAAGSVMGLAAADRVVCCRRPRLLRGSSRPE